MLGDVAAGASFTVRLALQPGDTVLRFSYRTISISKEGGFAGSIVVGSVGGTSASGNTSTPVAPTPVEKFFVGEVQTLTIPLPADAVGEVVFGIFGSVFSCGPNPGPSALLIDDLRAE